MITDLLRDREEGSTNIWRRIVSTRKIKTKALINQGRKEIIRASLIRIADSKALKSENRRDFSTVSEEILKEIGLSTKDRR